MSSASVQKLFCGIYLTLTFKGSFDEFVGENVFSPSYSSTILAPPPRAGLFGRVSQVVLVVKNPSANTEDLRDLGLIPGLEISFEKGNDNPLQYSCLENPMDRRAWWVTVHRVATSGTQLK